jgi:nicotinate phosphoribosyltransferase
LKGFSMDSSELDISQDEAGHLQISITGFLWRTVFWEMPILSTISELTHELNGEFVTYDREKEYKKSFEKAKKMITNGVRFSDFGTRRRFSFEHQDLVIQSFIEAQKNQRENCFIGTSNVFLAKKYDLTPIGTMSHQFVETCSLYGYTEANYLAMDYWQEVYAGNLGIYLYDTYTRQAFFKNFTVLHAKLFDGLRVDSGNNITALEEIIAKYKELGIDPSTKSIVFSNALSTDKAIELHQIVNGRMKDSYGIGTHLTCDVDNVMPMNIVVKLTAAKITEKRAWKKVVKLSDDLGKYTGDPVEIEICKKTLDID